MGLLGQGRVGRHAIRFARNLRFAPRRFELEKRRMNKPVLVAALGEVLWDVFPDARRPGGAPANVAFHASQLGAQGVLVSRVGNDEPGSELVEFLRGQGLDCVFVQTDLRAPTGDVTISFTRGNPRFAFREPAAWDFIEWTDALEDLAEDCHAVCFGTLARRHEVSRDTIMRFLRRTRAWRIFDMNLRDPFADRDVIVSGLSHCEAVKMNDEENRRLARLLGWRRPIEKRLMREFGIELVAVTRGKKGCVLVDRTGRVEAAAPLVITADPVGAGDAFTAALILGRLDGMPLIELADFANEAGAYVAGQHGAMPVPPRELCDFITKRKASST
jgi:fructokinase